MIRSIYHNFYRFSVASILIVLAILPLSNIAYAKKEWSDCFHQVSLLFSSLSSGKSRRLYLSSSPGSPIVYSNVRACFRLGKTRLFLNCLRGIVRLHTVIEPRSNLNVHSTKIAEIVSRPQFTKRMEEFEGIIEKVKLDLENENMPSQDLWSMVLDITNGDREEAIDFLMLFVQDKAGSNIVWRLERLGVENPVALFDKLQKVRGSIYEIIKKTMSLSHGTKNFGLPNFLGSPPYGEVYHFWDAAFISKELVKQGIDPPLARYLALLNGDTYEKIMYHLLILWYPDRIWWNFGRLDSISSMVSIAHPLSHIAYHIRGAYLGTVESIEDIPGQIQTVEFIKRNFWNHYRAIAFDEWGGPSIERPDWNIFVRTLNEVDREKFFIFAILATAYSIFGD